MLSLPAPIDGGIALRYLLALSLGIATALLIGCAKKIETVTKTVTHQTTVTKTVPKEIQTVSVPSPPKVVTQPLPPPPKNEPPKLIKDRSTKRFKVYERSGNVWTIEDKDPGEHPAPQEALLLTCSSIGETVANITAVSDSGDQKILYVVCNPK